jgi:hypothetical protein
MDAATILLILAAAGQAAWTPDRYSSPPPASSAHGTTAPSPDRYAIPPSNSSSRVAPPPGVVDRARTAVTETGTTLRDGLEAGIDAANQQLSRSGNEMLDPVRSAGRELQGWTAEATQQFPVGASGSRAGADPPYVAANNGAATNPFSSSSAQPASLKRGGVAPPPWSGASATADPDWTTEASQLNAAPDLGGSTAMIQRNDSGWTSIRTDVPAPPMLIPKLLTVDPQEAAVRTASNDGRPSFPPNYSSRESYQGSLGAPPRSVESAAPADSWSTGWGNGAQPATIAATIGRDDTNLAAGNTRRDVGIEPLQPANLRLQDVSQQDAPPADRRQASSPPSQPAANSWVDLWAENDPLPDARQNAAATPAGAAQAPHNAGSPPLSAATHVANSSGEAPVVTLPAANSQPGRKPSAAETTGEQPPWMPLLVVSLSLAGSLGANLFLGFSYLDARQKYRSLVHRTAGKLRRSAAAA